MNAIHNANRELAVAEMMPELDKVEFDFTFSVFGATSCVWRGARHTRAPAICARLGAHGGS